MKTYPLFAFVSAFAFAPLSFELSASLLFATGLVCVLFNDYAPKTGLTRLRLAPAVSFPRRERPIAPALELAA